MNYQHGEPHGKTKRNHSVLWIILRDVILFAIALNVFALFHHVLPRKMQPVEASRYASSAPTQTPPPVRSNSAEIPSAPPSATPTSGEFTVSFAP